MNINIEVFPNLHEHVPLIAVGHERDRHTDTAESSRTTDTVQVGLVIRLLLLVAGLVDFGDILDGQLAIMAMLKLGGLHS